MGVNAACDEGSGCDDVGVEFVVSVQFVKSRIF